MTGRSGALALLGCLALASMLAGCRDEDLDDVERASRNEAARAEAARLHEGATYFLMDVAELDGAAALSAAVGFDVVMPRGLPEGLEVSVVIGQAAQPFDGASSPALASVTMFRRGIDGLVQLLELEGPMDPSTAGEDVALGDGVGRLAEATGEGSPGRFTTLTFEGCGLTLAISMLGLDAEGPPITRDQAIAMGTATRAGCAEPLPETPVVRYFQQRLVDLPDRAAFDARAGFDVVLPSYLPPDAMPTWVTGQPFLPGFNGEPDGRGAQAVYGLDGGTLLLTEGTRRLDVSAGTVVAVGDRSGRLLREASEDGVQLMLAWEGCGLEFALTALSFNGAADGPPLDETELVRIAASMLDGCE
ncbi:MAG: hypothetical protein R3C39_11535 [Dehalococcoidia bacterium]